MDQHCPEYEKEVTETVVPCNECSNQLGNDKISPAARYKIFYDLIVQEKEYLRNLDISSEYKLCKALAACYELQDYLSNRLAEHGFD